METVRISYVSASPSMRSVLGLILLVCLPPAALPQKITPPTLTGTELPSLIRDAITVLNAELAELSPVAKPLVAADVILVNDVNHLCDLLNAANPQQVRQLAEEMQMFVAATRAPIYVIVNSRVLAALKLYEYGDAQYLRYTFAALLGHEWRHAFLGERGETRAYAFELELQQRFLKRGLLPPECASDIETTAKRLLEAQRNEAVNGADQSVMLRLRNR